MGGKICLQYQRERERAIWPSHLDILKFYCWYYCFLTTPASLTDEINNFPENEDSYKSVAHGLTGHLN